MSTKEWLVLLILGFLVEVSTTADPIQIHNSLIKVSSEGVPYGNMTADKVNDGIVHDNGQVVACGCCAALYRPAWVQLTLDKTYLVEKILVFGRTDTGFNMFYNITLSLGRQDQSLENEALTSTNRSFAMTILTPPREVDTVRVSVTQQFDYMVICEIMIYRQADCKHGKYSANCSKECHCLSGPCESVTGICMPALCKDGWRGPTCNKTCNPGTFGSNCSNICHCLNNKTCSHLDGSCPYNQCAAGWTHANCSVACNPSTFGSYCSNICHCHNNATCNNVDGVCSNKRCAAGWTHDNCSVVCKQGTFGSNCSNICHCVNNEICSHVDGGCPNNQCAAGWAHANCSVACNPSTFGSNCSNICNCHNNATCNHVDGSCTNNQCAAGWTHDNCSVACKAGFYGQGCSMDCHCDTCHHVNGSCVGSIQCHDGFRMENGFCTTEVSLSSTECPVCNTDRYYNALLAVSSVLGVVVAAVIVVIVVYVRQIHRKHAGGTRSNRESSSHTYDDLARESTNPDHYDCLQMSNKKNNTIIEMYDNWTVSCNTKRERI